MAHVAGHADRPKDPLARYTGPTTVGPVPNKSWMDWSTTDPLWQQSAKGFVQGAGAPLRVMFDRNYANEVGTNVGNFISTNLPWLGNQMAKVPTGLVEGVGSGVMKATGVTDFQEAGRDFGKGNYLGGVLNTLEGAGYLATTARGVKFAKKPSLLMRDIGRTRSLPTLNMFGRTFGGQVIPKKLSVPAAVVTAAGSILSPITAGLSAMFGEKPAEVPGQPQQQPPLPPMGPVTTAPNGFQYSRNPVTGLNEVVGNALVDPETGFVFEYNPRTKQSEVVGRTTAIGEQYIPWEKDPRNPNRDLFPNLSALEEEVFAKQIRDLDAESDLLIKELQGKIGAQRAEAQRQIQRIGREGAGSSQDVASELAELGVDTSPGQLDVRLEQIGQQTAEGQAAQRRSLANYISGVQSQISATERKRAQQEADIILARQAAEDAALEEALLLEEITKLTGGS